MPLPNLSMSFSPFAILTAAEMNDLVENIEALAGGTGLNDNSITASKLATNAITLGYAQVTANFSATSIASVTGLTVTVTIPTGLRKVRITVFSRAVYVGTASQAANVSLWDGAVTSGTQISSWIAPAAAGAGVAGMNMQALLSSVPAGSKTF